MKNIIYAEYGSEGLDLIAPLWQKLNEHHRARAHRAFHKHFDTFTFDTRKKQLADKSKNGDILVDLARDGDGILIGYCVSTVSENKTGEIESIYIEEAYRRNGIGDELMKRALKWLDARKVARKVVAVVSGNEEAFPFYRRYGFRPRVSILEQAESGENGAHD